MSAKLIGNSQFWRMATFLVSLSLLVPLTARAGTIDQLQEIWTSRPGLNSIPGAVQSLRNLEDKGLTIAGPHLPKKSREFGVMTLNNLLSALARAGAANTYVEALACLVDQLVVLNVATSHEDGYNRICNELPNCLDCLIFSSGIADACQSSSRPTCENEPAIF